GLQECGEKEETIHKGVQCDQCNVCPIRGTRYKCCVCSDFDLCGNCESFGKHNPSHPLIKMNRSMESLQPRESNDLTGVQEWCTNYFHMLSEWFGPHARSARGVQFAEFGWGEPHPHPHPHAHPNPYSQWHPSQGPTFCHHQHGEEEHEHEHGHDEDEDETDDAGVEEDEKPKRCRRRGCRVKWMRFAKHMKQAWEKDHRLDEVSKKQTSGDCKKKKDRPMAEFVKHGNVPDGSYFPVETILQKTWEIKNTGTAEWGDDVKLVFLKGNESLPLEKEFSVPNAKPQEIVKVSAMIRSPAVSGRFCAYFRLQKKGIKFGPRIWVDFHAVGGSDPKEEEENGKEKDKEKTKEQEQIEKEKRKQFKRELKQQAKLQCRKEKLAKKMKKIDTKLSFHGNEKDQLSNDDEILQKEGVISCMCGAPLIQTTPLAVYYPNVRVSCDICGCRCPSSGSIYHCPAEKTRDHPGGYDLCLNCVRFQMNSFDESEQEEQQQPQKPEVQQPQRDPVDEKDKDKKENAQQGPKEGAEKNAITQDDAEPTQTKPDGREPFQYTKEVISIMNMGFKDIEKIKYLLVNKKGDCNQVITELLSQ
ncbi:hypothetical protein RFI_00914, partial [Reticulomyxa filosa]